MTSPVRLALLGLTTLTTALSLVLIGLTARHISFIQNLYRDKRNFVTVVYRVWSYPEQEWQQRTRGQVGFLPTNFSMAATYAVLVAGILASLCGMGVLYLNARKRDVSGNVSVTGRKIRTLRLANLPTILILHGLALAVLLAGTVVSWYQHNRDRFTYFNGVHINDRGIYDDARAHWTFEKWVCALAPHIPEYLTSVTGPMLRSLCTQAMVARVLVLVVLVLSAVGLGLHFWVWRRHNVAVRRAEEEGSAAPPYDEVAAARFKQVDIESQSGSGSGSERAPFSPVSPVDGVAEMPEKRTSAAAALDGAEVKEMMGETGHKEMEGETVAVEKGVDEKGGLGEKV